MSDRYTFGDTDLARERLRLLAELYDPASEDLLRRWAPPGRRHALDLGAGPGHTTRLLHRVAGAARTTGVERSARYVADAAVDAPVGVDFVEHDVTHVPFPVPPADLLFCRFLLTHLAAPGAAVAGWAEAATPGAVLIVQEVETLTSPTPALARYYELVGELQARYGQALHVGRLLDEALAATAWRVVSSAIRALTPDPRRMARLHLFNLRTWRTDPVAIEAFDAAELGALETALTAIVDGAVEARVDQGLREIVAVRG